MGAREVTDTLLVELDERAAMLAMGDTLADRWMAIVERISDLSGMTWPSVIHDLMTAGFVPDLPELADREFCEAIVEGSLLRISIVVDRMASGTTLH